MTNTSDILIAAAVAKRDQATAAGVNFKIRVNGTLGRELNYWLASNGYELDGTKKVTAAVEKTTPEGTKFLDASMTETTRDQAVFVTETDVGSRSLRTTTRLVTDEDRDTTEVSETDEMESFTFKDYDAKPEASYDHGSDDDETNEDESTEE